MTNRREKIVIDPKSLCCLGKTRKISSRKKLSSVMPLSIEEVVPIGKE